MPGGLEPNPAGLPSHAGKSIDAAAPCQSNYASVPRGVCPGIAGNYNGDFLQAKSVEMIVMVFRSNPTFLCVLEPYPAGVLQPYAAGGE